MAKVVMLLHLQTEIMKKVCTDSAEPRFFADFTQYVGEILAQVSL